MMLFTLVFSQVALVISNSILILWCLRFHRQRNVLHGAFNDAIEGKIGLYTMLSNELVEVLDQIEGVEKKGERE